MADQETVYQVWLPVIGRALAHLCMHGAHMGDKTLAEKAKFLEALGMERKEVAEMLGTSYGSITELIRQAKSKKKGKKGNAAGKKKAR